METSFGREWETLNVSVDEGIARVAFNRPEKLNAMNRTMRLELTACFEAIGQDADIRCVVVTGEGDAFSAGGDINDFKSSPQELHSLMGRVSHRWFKALWTLPQPVIAAVNGVAAGGGCNVALACDFVVACEEASFVHTFMNIGLVPDLGGMFVLPRLVGLQKAKEFALLGRRLSAAEAHEIGLVNFVTGRDELEDQVNALAHRLAALPPSAVTLTKRIMNRSFESSMEGVLDSEWMAQSFLFGTQESRAGIADFLGKGKSKSKSD